MTVAASGLFLMQPNRSDADAGSPLEVTAAWSSSSFSSSSSAAQTGPAGAPADVSFTSPPSGEAFDARPGCPLRDGLRVAATPEIVPALQQVWQQLGAATAGCPLSVTATEAADFLAGATDAAFAAPDVWIPDSSVWIDRARAAGVPLQTDGAPVATSPVVLALSPKAAAAVPSAAALLASRTTEMPIRVGVPDPNRSVAGASAVLDLRATVAGSPGANAAVTWALRSTPAGLPSAHLALLGGLADQPGVALPTTEQSVVAFNADAGSVAAVALYGTLGYSLDYPFATTTDNDLGRLLGDRLLTALRTDAGRRTLADNGFRDAHATTVSGLAASSGVNGSVAVIPTGPTAADVDRLVADVALSNEPSRLLAVLDVSGSMASGVPGAGSATRMDLARAAAMRGLGLYPDTSEIGLWRFSRTLDGPTDYQQLVPIGPLAATADGTSGAQRLQEALQSVQVVRDGGTGLYDTTLAAVRALRDQWDPERVNSVLLLTDGQNDDQGSISLEQLVATLQSEQDATKPVPVIAIAFGPDSDVTALQAISGATGGATYVAKDPRDIGEIFLDAVGRRLCRPNC